jgi:RNA polymerase sigma-54 factor
MNHQTQSQNQRLSVLPQQIQMLKLFHLNGCELQSRIVEELLDNPLLEETVNEDHQEVKSENSDQEYDGADEFQDDDILDYAIEHQNYLSEADIPQRPIPELADFRKELREQLRTNITTEIHLKLAEYLIDSLDDDGLVNRSMSEMADDFSFQNGLLISIDQMEAARQSILRLDPAGIGCLNIKEFLIIQLRQRNDGRASLAIELLEKNLDVLAHRDIDKVATLLGIDQNELHKVMSLIGSCQLKPLGGSDARFSNSITIDFVVTEVDDIFDVTLFHQRSSTLFVNHSLSSMLNKGKSGDKQELQYMKGKLSSAQWFVNAIQQRETTMLKVMKAIVQFQSSYFMDGDPGLLKPMILQDIGDITGAHISTISRITCNKYVDTPFGPILLKGLFSKGIENKTGGSVSNRVIQIAVEEVVSGESKLNPYTDKQIVSLLAIKGFNIARRTVAKYRERQGIPVVQIRASIARNGGEAGTSSIIATNNTSHVFNG